MIERKKYLSDDTKIRSLPWSERKAEAMSENYKEQIWYKYLDDDEKALLEVLRNAQIRQGDPKAELDVQPNILFKDMTASKMDAKANADRRNNNPCYALYVAVTTKPAQQKKEQDEAKQ